ncbi:MAG: cytochrome C oxidase subunit IV family protein [Planctomycetota bacterium]
MNEHNPALRHDPELAHVLPLRTYLGVFALLLVLTGVTTGIAYIDLGVLNTPIALSIASVKALSVILVFMHVKFSGKLVWLFVIGGFAWLLILFSFSLSDYYTRSVISGWGG